MIFARPFSFAHLDQKLIPSVELCKSSVDFMKILASVEINISMKHFSINNESKEILTPTHTHKRRHIHGLKQSMYIILYIFVMNTGGYEGKLYTAIGLVIISEHLIHIYIHIYISDINHISDY